MHWFLSHRSLLQYFKNSTITDASLLDCHQITSTATITSIKRLHPKKLSIIETRVEKKRLILENITSIANGGCV